MVVRKVPGSGPVRSSRRVVSRGERREGASLTWGKVISGCRRFPVGSFSELQNILRAIGDFRISPLLSIGELPARFWETNPGKLFGQAILGCPPEDPRLGSRAAFSGLDSSAIRFAGCDVVAIENCPNLQENASNIVLYILRLRGENDACFLFPGDPLSHKSWEKINEAYKEIIDPSLTESVRTTSGQELKVPRFIRLSNIDQVTRSEITAGLFKRVMRGYQITGPNADKLRAILNDPSKAEKILFYVNYFDAQEFAGRLSALTGRRFMLPGASALSLHQEALFGYETGERPPLWHKGNPYKTRRYKDRYYVWAEKLEGRNTFRPAVYDSICGRLFLVDGYSRGRYLSFRLAEDIS